MAGRKSGGVIDWQWLMQEMPIASDARSKRTRNLLFDRIDVDGNGILRRREVVLGFLNSIRNVRGIIDLKPVWTLCYQLTRAAVEPVVPIGHDIMDRNQFRVYVICVWMYMRFWEYFFCSRPRGGEIKVKLQDLDEVLKILEDFGYPDAQRVGMMLGPYLQNDRSDISFDKFVEVCLAYVLPEIGDLEARVEKGNALAKIGARNFGLLAKPDEVGIYESHSMETGQARMTGFIFKKMRKSTSDSSIMKSLAEEKPSAANPGKPDNSWTSQYRMQHTATKFHPTARLDPLNHRCHTERALTFSHPYFHVSSLSPGFKPDSESHKYPPIQRIDMDRLVHPVKRTEGIKPLQTAGLTMARRSQQMLVNQARGPGVPQLQPPQLQGVAMWTPGAEDKKTG